MAQLTPGSLIENYLSFWWHFFPEQQADVDRDEVLHWINEWEEGSVSQRSDAEMVAYQDRVAQVYGIYEREVFQHITLVTLFQHTHYSQALMPDRNLASIGCGPAALELWLCKNQGPRPLTLVDHSPGMLGRALQIADELQIADRATFIEADATQSGIPDSSADWVFCLNSMHWSANWERWIDEALRIAKPGGVVFLTCTLHMPRSGITQKQFEKRVLRRLTGVYTGQLIPPQRIGNQQLLSFRYYAIGRKK